MTSSPSNSFDQYIPRIKAESKARAASNGAQPVTHKQLKEEGLNQIGLGEDDTPRIRYLRPKAVNIGSNFTDGAEGGKPKKIKNVDYTDMHLVPSTYIDIVTLLASCTIQYDLLLTIVINAYLKIIADVKRTYGTASKTVLDIAIRIHAESAYGQYIRVLGISDSLLEIKMKRKTALIGWLNQLHDEVKNASYVIRMMKKAQKEAFLAKETSRKYKICDDEGSTEESDDDALA